MNVELEVGMDVSNLYLEPMWVSGTIREIKILEVLPNIVEKSKCPFVVKYEVLGLLEYPEVRYDSYTKEGKFHLDGDSIYDIKRKEVL